MRRGLTTYLQLSLTGDSKRGQAAAPFCVVRRKPQGEDAPCVFDNGLLPSVFPPPMMRLARANFNGRGGINQRGGELEHRMELDRGKRLEAGSSRSGPAFGL
jgi:hypothetical protein